MAAVLDLEHADAVSEVDLALRADLRRLESALVEGARDVVVHLRAHPPGLFEKDAHLRPHRLLLGEQVREN